MRLIRISLVIFLIELAAVLAWRAGWIFLPGPIDAEAFAHYAQIASYQRDFARTVTPPLDRVGRVSISVARHACVEGRRDLRSVRYYCAGRIALSPPEDVKYNAFWLMANRGMLFRVDIKKGEVFLAVQLDYDRLSGEIEDWGYLNILRLDPEIRTQFGF